MSDQVDQIPMTSPRLFAAGAGVWAWLVSVWERIRLFFSERTPTFRTALGPMVALSFVLFCRYPTTNYIFDEQEALLGNPYINQLGFKYEDAIYRDFWGLPANASIGSYRPIPNYLWRGLVEVGERGQRVIDAYATEGMKGWVQRVFFYPEPIPNLTEVARRSWFQHVFNLLFHGVNGAIFVAMAWRVSRRRMVAWVTGAVFVAAAILTEAVSGVVGIADVLGGMGALCALASLGMRAHAMPFGVFLSILFGLFSKESAIVCLPLIPVAALLSAPFVHPEKPARLARAALATVGALAAFVLYVELRKRWFPSSVPSELAKAPDFDIDVDAALSSTMARDFLIWFHQPPLPKDPLNNPFVDAQMDLRVSGAMRVYWRGLTQVVFPWTLSGDYSFPQEPIPAKLITFESVLGWGATVLPLGAALGLWLVSLLRERKDRQPIPKETSGHRRSTAPTDPPPAFAKSAIGAWYQLHRSVVLRTCLEVGVIAVSAWLTYKMVGIGPSEANKDMGDSDPALKISIPPRILNDALVYAALGCLSAGAFVEALWQPRKTAYLDYRLPLIAVGFVWLVVSYFPHSNMYVLLPTVRAERLWYFPVLGTTIVVSIALVAAYDKLRTTQWRQYAWAVPAAFLVFQAGRSYMHATDYRNDLIFWRETKDAVPHSSKAHLNYSVMAGARGLMQIRLEESHIARHLAPEWAMAHIYTGDTLCRMGRPEEAWPHYARGFSLGPGDKGLISLALQCMWDTKTLKKHEPELRILSADHPGSWIAFLADDTLRNGDKQGGVQREAKGRSYNQSAEAEETETTETTVTATADPEPSAKMGDSGSASGSTSGSVLEVEALPDKEK